MLNTAHRCCNAVEVELNPSIGCLVESIKYITTGGELGLEATGNVFVRAGLCY